MMKYLSKIAQFNMQKVVVFGLIAAAVFYFTLYDDGATIELSLIETNKQVSDQESKMKESNELLKQEEQIRSLVQQLSEQYKVISAQIPTEVQPFEILRTIDAMAITSGVVIISKEPRKAEKKDIIEEIPIRIVAEGRFTELTLFLFNLMNTERISRLLSFSIAAMPKHDTGRGPKASTLQLDVVLANYRFIGDSKEGSAGQGEVQK